MVVTNEFPKLSNVPDIEPIKNSSELFINV